MIFHLYKSRLKCLFRNKESIFWSYAFPIALITLFYFAFNTMYSSSDLKTINIAYVNTQPVQDEESENATDPLKAALEAAKISKELPLFKVSYYDVKEAARALEEDEIIAYVVSGEQAKVYVKRNGISQTIVKSFLDSYNRSAYTIMSILVKNPDAISQGILEEVMDYKSFTTEIKSDVKPDAALIYFYALVAMACLMSANWGLDEVVNIQGNRSNRGARINVSPIKKMKLLLINLCAAFTAHVGSIVLLLLYMLKVLDISFGNHFPQLILACFIGEIIGLFIGASVGVWVNKGPGVQGALTTSIIMVGSFLSGLMFGDVKYLILKYVPILSYINPVSLVSDSFYSLYYYDDFNHFYTNIVILVIMVVILGVTSFIGLRRKTYASI